MEGREDIRVGYQDVAALAKFYGVSTDYLFGLTDNRQHRYIDVDALRLSDPAIETLKSGSLNNRLVSETLAHPDFARLMQSVEIYIDRKLMSQVNIVNALYQFTENTVKENFPVAEGDENIALLQDAVVDEDGYLRFQLSERFNDMLKSLFADHKKDALPDEQENILRNIMGTVTLYLQEPDEERGKLMVLTKQMGLDISELTVEEIQVMKSVVRKAEKHTKQGGRR